MTYKELSELIKEYDIPEDVKLKSDSGWEVDATDMDGVFHNPDKNLIVFTMCPEDTRRGYYDKAPWVKLESWKVKAKATYAEYEEETTYFNAYKVDDELYVVHGEEYLYGLNREFKCLWKFSGRDILVAQDGSPAVKLMGNYIEVTDWLGYRYKVSFDGTSCEI